MTLPFFPLQSVFFPGEKVPLHIFEQRYKQLINDCKNEKITFGIPVYIHDSLSYGVEVQLMEVVTTYDGGTMDVVCVARQVFKINTFKNEMEGKLYAGGDVQLIENINDGEEEEKLEVIDKIKELYTLMVVSYNPVPIEVFNSYLLAHKMGLSFEQEYELLTIPKESARLHFLKSHLINTIHVLKEVNRTKEIIDQNGHFRNFDPLDFKDIDV